MIHKYLSAFYKNLSAFLQISLGLFENNKNLSAFHKNLSAFQKAESSGSTVKIDRSWPIHLAKPTTLVTRCKEARELVIKNFAQT